MNLFQVAKRKLLGFSVAEAMITLLVASIAISVAAPILTKRSQNANNSKIFIDEAKTVIEKQNTEIKTIKEELEKIKSGSNIPSGAIIFSNKKCSDLGAEWTSVPTAWQGRYPRIAGSYTICNTNGASAAENKDGGCIKGGTNASVAYGDFQGDAIRNITGSLTISGLYSAIDGAFNGVNAVGISTAHVPYAGYGNKYDFNSSAVVPTATENRVKTVVLYMCIKK